MGKIQRHIGKETQIATSKDEYRERYKELVGIYPPSLGDNGRIFIDNREVIVTINEGDLGTLTVIIKEGETEPSFAAVCGLLDLTFANKGNYLLCSILVNYDNIARINPMRSDTFTFTDYDEGKKHEDTMKSVDGSPALGDDSK